MKFLAQLVVCSVFSVVLKNLLYVYWTHKEGPSDQHLSDAWFYGVIAGVAVGLLVVEGVIAIRG
jgi:hypothetical protein